MVRNLLGERNGEKIGIMFYIAVRDVGEINLKQLYMFIKKALISRAFLLMISEILSGFPKE